MTPEEAFKVEQIYREFQVKGILLSREEIYQAVKPLMRSQDANKGVAGQ